VDFQAVETHSTGRGVPDSNYCVDGTEGWIEHKRAKRGRVDLSKEQVAWAERRMRHGGRVFLAVREGSRLWLFAGGAMRAIRSAHGRIAGAPALGEWAGGPARWGWDEVLELLKGLPRPAGRACRGSSSLP
jgi:hypothetical protein